MKIRFLLLSFIPFLLVSCGTTETSSVTADFRNQEGIYVVAYTADKSIRTRMEQQLADDLGARDMIAIVSSRDIDDIVSSQPADIIAEATKKKLLAVLMINQVAADGSDSIVKNPKRISPTHPTLKEFYSYSRELLTQDYDNSQEIFAEVNLFILDGGEAKLYWSGTTWSFQADNKGTAIRDISETIAKQLAQLRDR